ncbi:CU044_5270 family protein [Virgisporangium ochraceum]|nr:CU044_5270 family protein [Virgisporangium ochraceum]
MNEMELLQDVFGFDETPSAAARDRARTALLDRINGVESPAPRRPARWTLRAAAVVTAAAAVAVGVVVVTGGPAERTDRSGDPPAAVAAPPYAKPAGAAEFLENAAWTAARRAWVDPRPDQFMYVEFLTTENRMEVADANPNGALVPGQTVNKRRESWSRVDGHVIAGREDGGQLHSRERTEKQRWPTIPYDDLAGLTTPEKFDEWHHRVKPAGASPEALLTQFVLPPDVEAAIYRWLARQPGARVDPDAVNFDGRPAIALTYVVEDYLRTELLFDPETYALIGDRLVAIRDHVAESLDATRYIKAGDVFRLVIRNRFGIVDRAGDTP